MTETEQWVGESGFHRGKTVIYLHAKVVHISFDEDWGIKSVI